MESGAEKREQQQQTPGSSLAYAADGALDATGKQAMMSWI